MRAKKDTGKQRAGDRKLAMTALAASREKEDRDCLTVQEMAELVDGRCTDAQQHAYLEHLGQCDRCYREWAALRQDVVEPGRQRLSRALLSLLASRKGLSITGSAVGVAAAVMIFLNIRPVPMVMQSEEQTLPRGSFQKMEQSMTIPAETQRQETVDDVELAPSSPAPQQRKEKKEGEALLRERQLSGKAQEQHYDTGGATAPTKARRAAGSLSSEALSNVQMEDAKKLEGAQPVFVSLLRDLQSGCGEQRAEGAFWQDLQGRLSQPEGQRLREAIGDEKFTTLSSLVVRIVADGEKEKHCPGIEQIVNELLP